MKLATWNVNSLNVRLPHVLDWLEASPVDVLCLQETKLVDEKFPAQVLSEAGYASVFSGQRTYNGVAILTRRASVGEPSSVVAGLPGFEDEQKRLLTADIAGVRVVCAYFPNGQAVGSEKFAYKLRWMDALLAWVRAMEQPEALNVAPSGERIPLVLAGDFNVAPEDRDVHDPVAWAGQVLCSEDERERFRALIACGLVDTFREFEQPDRLYSWWDYRMLGFRRNAGLRIDHILCNAAMRARLLSSTIDREPRKREKPSDHAPAIAEFGPAG